MSYQQNKVTNLHLAIQKLNLIVIEPGKEFSFWYLVGSPSKRKGYKKGLSLRNGQIGYSTGGGLCQIGNLIYWMVLHSPLVVTERWRHSYDVFPDVNRTLPFGSGATLAYNYVDLRFMNPTNHKFQLKLWLTDTHLHGKIFSDSPPEFSYKIEEKEHRFESTSWGGFIRHNKIIRYTKKNNIIIKKEEITENHAYMMYNPMLK